LERIAHGGQYYPAFQAEGFAAQFAIPFAKKFCKGYGYDIGCNRMEWCLPGAVPIDPQMYKSDAYNLPDGLVDYIFSSHCLEHLPSWIDALDHWTTRLKFGGTLFLYLPDYSQTYWRPWHNRKHLHVMDKNVICDFLRDRGYLHIFASGVDLNNSFMIVAERR
jgi:SAM-dependent methyltransferase